MAILNKAIANSIKNKFKSLAAGKVDVSGYTGIYDQFMQEVATLERQAGIDTMTT